MFDIKNIEKEIWKGIDGKNELNSEFNELEGSIKTEISLQEKIDRMRTVIVGLERPQKRF